MSVASRIFVTLYVCFPLTSSCRPVLCLPLALPTFIRLAHTRTMCVCLLWAVVCMCVWGGVSSDLDVCRVEWGKTHTLRENCSVAFSFKH